MSSHHYFQVYEVLRSKGIQLKSQISKECYPLTQLDVKDYLRMHLSSALHISSQLPSAYQSRHQHPHWSLPAAGHVKQPLSPHHNSPVLPLPLQLHLKTSLRLGLPHPPLLQSPPHLCHLTRKIFLCPIMSTIGEL